MEKGEKLASQEIGGEILFFRHPETRRKLVLSEVGEAAS